MKRTYHETQYFSSEFFADNLCSIRYYKQRSMIGMTLMVITMFLMLHLIFKTENQI